MPKFIPASILALLATLQLFATDPYPRNHGIDIKHYRFRIDLNDSTNAIAGVAEVTILFKDSLSTFELDLVGKSPDGNGMAVSSVSQGKKPLPFAQKGDRLSILLPHTARAGEETTISIAYGGTPSDGLVIGTNKFGDRVFFGDNWPNRASRTWPRRLPASWRKRCHLRRSRQTLMMNLCQMRQ